jgi:DNA-binding XRE family transcriptional regulator
MKAAEALRLSGQNHRTLRIAKGFSVETMAVLSGVDESIIIALEDGDFDFPVNLIYDLAATLNVDFRQITVDPTAFRRV